MTKKISELVSGSPIAAVTDNTHFEVEEGGNSYGATAAQVKTYLSANFIGGAGTVTDNAVVRFDGTGGATIQQSGVIIDDSDNVTGIAALESESLSITGGSAPTIGLYSSGTNTLTFCVNGTAEVALGVSNFYPFSNKGNSLGSSVRQWGGLWLGDATAINWNNGETTITQAPTTLTIGGAGFTTLALGTGSITMTGILGATGARVTKGWFTDIESTNWPTVGGTAINSYSVTNSQQAAATDTNQEAIDAAFSTFAYSNILTPHRNLVVKYVTTSTVDIDASAVILFNAAGYARKFSNINLTVDITASGANGLDTGSEANSTWCHLWVIANQTGTVAGILSTSSTAPTLPSGYVFYGYVGAVYNNSSGNFATFHQRGTIVTCASVVKVNAVAAATFTSVSLTDVIPSTATSARMFAGVDASSGTHTVGIVISGAGSGTTPTYGNDYFLQASVGTAGIYSNSEVQTTTPQSLVYYTFGTNNRGYITVTGWRF